MDLYRSAANTHVVRAPCRVCSPIPVRAGPVSQPGEPISRAMPRSNRYHQSRSQAGRCAAAGASMPADHSLPYTIQHWHTPPTVQY